MSINQPAGTALSGTAPQTSYEGALRQAKEFAESIAHTMADALLVLGPDLRVQMANNAFYKNFQLNQAATVARRIYDLGNGQWDIPALHTLLEEILPQNKIVTGYEVAHTFASIGPRTLLLNGRRLEHDPLVLLIITDITEHKRNEANLAFLADVNGDFVTLIGADAILNCVGEKLARYLGLSRCDFSMVEEETGRITTIYDWRRDPNAPSALGEHQIATFLTPLAQQHYRAGKVVVINDVHHNPMINAPPAMMDALHIRSVVDAPYLENGRWKSLLSVCRAEATVWRADEIALIDELAARIYIRLERAHAEEALRVSETRFRLMADSVPELIWLSDAEGRVEFLNKRWLDYAGTTYMPTTAAEVAAQFIHPADAPQVMAAFAEAQRTGQTFEVEQRNQRANGEYRWFLNRAAPYRNPQTGAITQWFGIGIDIDDRKRNEANLTFLAELMADFAPLKSVDELMQMACAKTLVHFGLTRVLFVEIDEAAAEANVIYECGDAASLSLVGAYHIADFYTDEERRALAAGRAIAVNDTADAPRSAQAVERFARLGVGALVSAPYVGEGRWKFVLSAMQDKPRSWRADEIALLQELSTHIWLRLDRARTETALRESEARLRIMMENLPGGAVFIVDHNLQYLLAAGEALQAAGFTPDDLVGKSLFDALSPAIAAAHEPMYRQALAGMPFRHEHESYGRAYVSRGTPLRGADGEVYGVLVVSYDITDRKQAEVALQHLNATLEQQVDTRTAQVRALASALTMAEQEERRRISQILHDDLQQLLYGMQMRVMAMINDIREDNYALLAEYAKEVYTWMGDAIQTTRQLTVDISPPVLKHEGLADTLRWLVTQMATVNGLHVDLHAAGPTYVADEDMRVLLFQIVRELLFNVVKHAQTDRATVELAESATGELRITIADAGRGFDVNAALAKGSESFGLFSANERLKLFGGRMEIQSGPDQGTRVTLYAPMARKERNTVPPVS